MGNQFERQQEECVHELIVYPAPVPMKIALSSIFCLAACSTQKAPAPKACCDQPEIAAGVAPFKIVADDTNGPSDGEKVTIEAALSQKIRREQLYPVLHTLYRHAMKRRAFEPIVFEANVLVDKSIVGTIARPRSQIGPRCENLIPLTFDEEIRKAFAELTGHGQSEDSNDSCHLAEKKTVVRPDETFTRKPQLKLDEQQFAVEVTHPYLELGKDEYVKTLAFPSAMRDWIDYTGGLFGKVRGLKQVTYVGLHADQPVVKITVTREQFQAALASLQDEIASHAAVTVASLGSRMEDASSAAKEQAAFHTKTYKAALGLLPKTQVFVSPKLK